MMTDEMPAWADDPDDPRFQAVDAVTSMIVERVDQADGLEQLMRLNAGTAALHVSREHGATFVDLMDFGIEIRD